MIETSPRQLVLASLVMLVLVASAAGALVSLFVVGHRQRSVVLVAMFIVWVLSPFVALRLLNGRARSWSPAPRRTLQYATVLVALVAAARYISVLVWPIIKQPAATFMIVPFLSWIAIAGVVVATKRQR